MTIYFTWGRLIYALGLSATVFICSLISYVRKSKENVVDPWEHFQWTIAVLTTSLVCAFLMP